MQQQNGAYEGAHAQQRQFGRDQPRQPQQKLQGPQTRCYTDEQTGDVVVKFKRTEIVRVRPRGEVELTSGGYHNTTTLDQLNAALNLIGIRVTNLNNNWTITDGKSLTRFQDGVVLPAKGAATAARGMQLLQAFNNPNRAQLAAATAASNAAAAAAGLIRPPHSMGGAMMMPPPFGGFPPPFGPPPPHHGFPHIGAPRGGMMGPQGGAGAFGGLFPKAGGGAGFVGNGSAAKGVYQGGPGHGRDSEAVRRQKSQGRFQPY